MTEVAVDRLKEIGQRLALAIKQAGGIAVVSQSVGKGGRSISRYIAGDAEMPLLTAAELADVTKVSLTWLLTGEGSATSDISAASDDSTMLPLLHVEGSAGSGRRSEGEGIVSRLPFSRALLRELGVRSEHCHFIRARGDSMEPTISDGAVVLIDTARRDDREDGIYVLMVGDDVRIKRLAFNTFGGLAVMSDNPAYPDETLGRGDLDQVKIVGKVVWVGGVV
jgi:phage repressor protein C with HTH and peptisase S24 domain